MNDVKHQWGYDDTNKLTHINDTLNSKYYLYPNKTIQIIPKKGDINKWHFALHPGDIDYVNESPEHYNAKHQIINDGFFNYKDYKIYIENARAEITLSGSRYRADLYGNLPCGTSCIVEVVKTSMTSESKIEFIEENQILTFEIYIDDKGNQITHQFNCIGNSEMYGLEREISKFRKGHFELQNQLRQIQNNSESNFARVTPKTNH
jgi:hypothetical protein